VLSVELVHVYFFKLEEEGMSALLLHLLQVNAETAIFGSAFGLGCCLVVEIVQPTDSSLFVASQYFKLEDNGG
jgi:hypothetical protein